MGQVGARGVGTRGGWFASLLVVGTCLWSSRARAIDLPDLRGEPLKLDVTEGSILTQRFDPRLGAGERPGDGYFGFWINRINVQLSSPRWTFGLRLDSSQYWHLPQNNAPDAPPPADPGLYRDQLSQTDAWRYPSAVYPAKLWFTYSLPGVELTLGDAYVQLARGLVLSMRKIDDLGIDTTLRGAKVAVTKGPFAATVVAGLANPSRVDEATGQTLLLEPNPPPGGRITPVFGSDRIVAGEFQAGRGGPIVLATTAARVSRCSPYPYTKQGIDDKGVLSDVGSCGDSDTKTWLQSLGSDPTRNADTVNMVAQSVELPHMGPLGSLYVVGVVQDRVFLDPIQNGPTSQGTAVYATYSGSYGPIVNTLELKDYRNFYPVAAAVNSTKVGAFSNVAYSLPPTAEIVTQDNLSGSFNSCVTGGRLRTDARLSKDLVTYVQAIYARSRSENGGTCDRDGDLVKGDAGNLETRVWDGTAGVQLLWDQSRSYLFSSVEVRNDETANGAPFHREGVFYYTFSKYLGHSTSLEVTGRTRNRRNGGPGERWQEGENYIAVKISPKWVISQGYEYTGAEGLPHNYINGGLLYRFTSDSNIKILAGQQRGGLKCVNGVCRFFPAFSGVRAELTLRF